MQLRETLLRSLLIPVLLTVVGCQTPRPPEMRDAPEAYTVNLIVAELQMHLRDDIYRMNRALTRDGRDVFTVSLWRLDRLQRMRGLDLGSWENIDIVIEFARARALERLRRYSEAADAYDRVVQRGSLLAEPSEDASFVMRRFTQHIGASSEPFVAPEDEIRFLDARVERWRELAWQHRGTSYEPLALAEGEAWEMLRLDWIARNRSPKQAIEAATRLVERHGSSKLYAGHLMRLGDFYAEAARREHLKSRAKLVPFDPERYSALLDQAFSAYELASDQRRPDLRRQATNKIEALRAYHQDTVRHAP